MDEYDYIQLDKGETCVNYLKRPSTGSFCWKHADICRAYVQWEYMLSSASATEVCFDATLCQEFLTKSGDSADRIE